VNRRDALQRIGLVLGAAVTPKVASAVQAGFVTPPAGQALRTLTPQQAELVAALAEHIIPATDTPGARAARVDAFIDALLADIFTAEERERFLTGLADVDARARAAAGTAFVECPARQQVALLEALEREGQHAGAGQAPFFPWIKEFTLVGYYTSEIGASQELRYVHVAGRYDGDVPYEQVGRAYS
jgi:hypothetical protein